MESPFSAYNEVEAYRYDSIKKEYIGPYVYFSKSRSAIPNYNSFYFSVWNSDVDMSNMDERCYENLCDKNICNEDQLCREIWESPERGTDLSGDNKKYHCCDVTEDGITDCTEYEPGNLNVFIHFIYIFLL